MVIGPRFAIGSIPKTGTDAVHQYCDAIGRPGWVIDTLETPTKHDPLYYRPQTANKEFYAVTFRRLASWMVSFMHEIALTPQAWTDFDVRDETDALDIDHWINRDIADKALAVMGWNRPVTDFLRTEHLADDLEVFLAKADAALTDIERQQMLSVATKGARRYDHDLRAWMTSRQFDRLYQHNALWMSLEKRLYGVVAYPDSPPPCTSTCAQHESTAGDDAGIGRLKSGE